jgi:hypothetical protein
MSSDTMIILLPFVLVTVASYPLMRWAGYDRAGSVLFSLCSPFTFGVAGGAFMVVGAPLSFEVINLLTHLGHPDALSQGEADLLIAACGYIAGFYVIARRIRRENEQQNNRAKTSGQ